MKIYLFTRYDNLGASSRVRFIQFFPILKSIGSDIKHNFLISNKELSKKYSFWQYSFLSIFFAYIKRINQVIRLNKDEIIWIEKELFPYFPLLIEMFFLKNKKYIIDFDDAIFHNYDKNTNKLIRFIFKNKIETLMKNAYCVSVGNKYLEKKAYSSGAKNIKKIPSVIDLKKYENLGKIQKNKKLSKALKIVWIGSPATSHYLNLISKPLQVISKNYDFTLRIIGSESFKIEGVKLECLRWEEDLEAKYISECDIGIMPLMDTPWDRGKCGYKLIQYMACYLPVIASPIGINKELVKNEKNGFLASCRSDWENALKKLLNSYQLRQKMGKEGRKLVEKEYSLQTVGLSIMEIFKTFNN